MARTGLIVDRIDVIPLVAPLVREFRGSHYGMTQRATVVTRIHTRDGVVGEAYAADEVDSLGAIVRVIENEIAPQLLGQSLFRTEAVWASTYPVTFDILRDRRIGLVAMACIDSAMWDAVGKALDQSLHLMWGGFRSEVPMIAIGGYYGEPLGPVEEEIAYYREVGLAGVKFKIGGRDPVTDLARVRRARAAAGEDFVIAVDANQGYTVAEALQFCRGADDLSIRWFEEPVGWANDRRDLAAVRAMGGIPVAAGQSEYSPAGCRALMEAGAIDVCNFDASWSGGPTTWLRMAALAQTFSVQVAHHEEPHVAAHLIASQPHGTFAECFHPDRDPFWWHLVANRPELRDGMLALPDGPGFGWELDEGYIARYRV